MFSFVSAQVQRSALALLFHLPQLSPGTLRALALCCLSPACPPESAQRAAEAVAASPSCPRPLKLGFLATLILGRDSSGFAGVWSGEGAAAGAAAQEAAGGGGKKRKQADGASGAAEPSAAAALGDPSAAAAAAAPASAEGPSRWEICQRAARAAAAALGFMEGASGLGPWGLFTDIWCGHANVEWCLTLCFSTFSLVSIAAACL